MFETKRYRHPGSRVLHPARFGAGRRKETGMAKLLAGAARRCVNPDEETLALVRAEGKYSWVDAEDDLVLRVIVLGDGVKKMLILTSDISTFPVTGELLEQLKERYGCGEKDLFFGGTRTHNSISTGSRESYSDYGPGSERFVRFVHEKLYEALDEALAHMVPARIGAAVGVSGINGSREFPSPVGTIESQNHSAPPAYRLRVVRIEAADDGRTIAVLVNYSMHCCLLCWNTIIGEYDRMSGDVGGAVARYVERYGKETYPVAWCCGGGVDRQPTIYSRLERCAVDENGEFHLEREVLPIEGTRMLLRTYAAEQGLDVIRTMEGIRDYSDEFDYFSEMERVDVPSRDGFQQHIREQMPDEDPELRYVQGMDLAKEPGEEPVHFQFRLAVLDGIAFAGVNGSPYSENYMRLADLLPFGTTVLFDDCGGYVSSIPTPEAEENHIYGHGTLQNKCWTSRQATEAMMDSYLRLLKSWQESRV